MLSSATTVEMALMLVRRSHVACVIVNTNHGIADGKRFVVRADEKLSAFVELESPIGVCRELS